MDDELLGRQSAFDEAKALYGMIGEENTVDELRELIAVPPRIECALRAFGRAHPEEAHSIERTLKFRLSVAREFERPVREGVPVADLPDVEKSELDAPEETFAVAYA